MFASGRDQDERAALSKLLRRKPGAGPAARGGARPPTLAAARKWTQKAHEQVSGQHALPRAPAHEMCIASEEQKGCAGRQVLPSSPIHGADSLVAPLSLLCWAGLWRLHI